MQVIKIPLEIKKRSNTRPKSLILYIPAKIRDIMEFKHGTKISLEVVAEDQEKIIKIRKIDD